LGYSARYHAASLAAVFLALAVGILIGAGLGDNLVSDTEENLRESLEGDIEEARGEAGDLQVQLDRERAFADRAYPALVADTLIGRQIGVLALGDLPSEVSADIEEALEPTGGELAQVAVVRLPPDPASLKARLGPGFAGLEEDNGQLEDLARNLGVQLAAGGGKQLDKLREQLFSQSSGEGGRLHGVVVVRGSRGELEPEDEASVEALESGLVDGLANSEADVVAVERSEADESSIPFFAPFDVATVDSVDLTSGQVALVFALLGAEGNFGIKDTANSLLPELLQPTAP
jgi:hypothetical protein